MEKVYEISEKTKLTYGRGYVYSLQYHLIWCTKYRKKVLTDGIDIQCKEMLTELADQYSFQILAMEVMHSSAPGLPPTVHDIRHGQNHEGKPGQKAVLRPSGIKETVVGRPSLESILLRSDCQ